MRLKRLETYGFKSFADRLTFDFEPGITAIIGPNGCGKSNVVDAIKWVVGEQSAKALRGSDMSDVIFNGCATRRPLPLAEVTLTLDEAGIPGVDGEMAITRRLTRDGVSSYFLNGKACRLKDIKDLLLGTGIGTSAYSTIEQGKIGFILEASTKDRRMILEEASGISRYKAQRKIALRKLERVRSDLERIGQVLGEVEKQLRNVRRQAEKALRYQELAARLKELRLVFALEEFGRLRQEREALRAQIAQCTDEEAGLASKLGELEALLAEADARLLTFDSEIRSREQERANAQSRRDVAGQQAKDAKHRLVEIDQQEAEDRKALDTLGVRMQDLQQARADQEKRLSEVDSGTETDDGLSALYQARRAELDRVMAAIDARVAEVEQRKSKEIEVLREITRVATDLNHLQTTEKALQDRLARLQGRAGGHDSVLTTAHQAESAAKQAADAALETAAAAHRHLDELIRQREESAAGAQQLEHELQEMRHEEGRADSRLRILSDIESRAEGISAGARGILKEMDRFPGIRGIVADLFQVEQQYELAIETALGGSVQDIIADNQDSAKAAIEFLKRERRGRATFLPLDDIQGRGDVDRQLLRQPGVVGVARDLIKFDKKFAPAFDYLLGGIIICETLDHALALRRRERVRQRLVTLDGDVVNPGGAMTGGRHQGSGQGGLVSRKNEIRRLEERLKEIAEARQTKLTGRDEAKKKAFEVAMQVEQQRKAIQAAERAVGDAKALVMKAERDRLHAEEFAASFGGELEEIRSELATLGSDSATYAARQGELETLRASLEVELQQLQQRLAEEAKGRDTLQEEVSTLRVDLATTQERREALRNHIAHLSSQFDDLLADRTERERRLGGLGERRRALTEAAAEYAAVHEREAAVCAQLAAGLDALIKERDALYGSVEGQRQEARELSARRRQVEQRRAGLELQENEKAVRAQTTSERILELYEIDLEQAFANWERPKEINWPALRKELDTTEVEFQKLGPVNLAAIDELKEVEARYEFLAKSHGDLAAAAEKLEAIITEINDTSRRLFKKTYVEVRRNFQELFRKLYGGGKADLVLEQDCEDILEAGIDIIAQPPGKQPKSITLLSGGEKALTAVALLFAVYMTKPSPFCILDEVDAPLDESNTDVYSRMVREFCTQSQFLVITHNKRTMQYADAIYGITQAEQGVSTKISVKLEELDDPSKLVSTVQGRGPFAD